MAIIIALGVAIAALILIPTVYQSPSCTDQKQNQEEEGVDCGGPCSYLCAALVEPPVVRFTKALAQAPGRVDAVAYVENLNRGIAARNVPYTLTLYGANRTLVKTTSGVIDLPPFTVVPVFVPRFLDMSIEGAQAFLSIENSEVRWFSYEKPVVVPTVEGTTVGGSIEAPRVTATITNKGVTPFKDITLVVVVYDTDKNVMAASQTIIPSLGAQRSTLATFTWSAPFPRTPAQIEITPLLPLSP